VDFGDLEIWWQKDFSVQSLEPLLPHLLIHITPAHARRHLPIASSLHLPISIPIPRSKTLFPKKATLVKND
jgi:hypothetical protein